MKKRGRGGDERVSVRDVSSGPPSSRSKGSDNVGESAQTLVDVDGLLETVLVVSCSTRSESFGSSQINEVEDSLCTTD